MLAVWLAWASLASPCASGQRGYWENSEMYRLNKVQPHGRIMPDGGWSISLDGDWQSCLFESPQKATLSPARWLSASLPLHAAVADSGTGNATTVYMRQFALPARWHGRRTIIKFGAGGAGMTLYVNGREVGYSQDSKSPAEWDITKYLQTGNNRVAVKVVSHSDGSHLDCRHTAQGITRSVELYSVPQTYITDIKVSATVDTANWRTGFIDLMIDLNREVQGGSVVVQVNGRTLRHSLEPRDWFASVSSEVGSVAPWSDTTPTLYPLTVRLLDAAGRETERITKQIGFRNIEIAGGALLLNGQRVQVRGVVRREVAGQTPDSMRREIAALKAAGVNAVRTWHCPADERWYDLCDSVGLMVWDEVNVDPDAEADLGDKRWLNPVLDRVFNLYKRDRNHPSVVVWSLGNGRGYCADEAYRFLKGKDPMRPVVQLGHAYTAHSDIVAPERPTPQHIASQARSSRQGRPFVAASLLGDAEGTSESIDTLLRYRGVQGGFAEWHLLGDAYLRPALEEDPSEVLAEMADEPLEIPAIPVVHNPDDIVPAAIVGSREPSPDRSNGYPWCLTDGRQASAALLDEGWVAYKGVDTLDLVLMLPQPGKLGTVAVGACHNPAQGAMMPLKVQACWSSDGKRWGEWEPLALTNPPADPYEGQQRLLYSLAPRKAKGVRFVKLRLVGRSSLPAWHRLPKEEAWMLIDELSLRRR